MALFEVDEAASKIRNEVDENANIFLDHLLTMI